MSPEAPFATFDFGIKVDDRDGGTTLLLNRKYECGWAGIVPNQGQGVMRCCWVSKVVVRRLTGGWPGLGAAGDPLQMQYYEARQPAEKNKEDNVPSSLLANQGFTFSI